MLSQEDPDRVSLAESAEILRIVLPKMRTHADGYAPASYSLWYEYVRGALPRLCQEIDALLAERDRLTAAETQALFDAHIRDRSERAFAAARARFATMLTKMRSTMDAAAVSGDAFDAMLREFNDAIDGSDPGADVADAVARVGAGTSRFRQSVQALNGALETNRLEVDRLTQELGRLREDVSTDPLTGLANRRGLDAAIAGLAEDGAGHDGPTAGRLSIAMIDIDHFKKVNDTHGHLVGDRVIQHVAATLRSCVRGSDLCARFGGEEFLLLLRDTTPAGARTVVEHVRNALRRAPMPTSRTGMPLPAITLSAGIAGWTRDEPFDACIERADQALYASKRDGRDRITVVD